MTEFTDEVIARSPHLKDRVNEIYQSGHHISAEEIIGDNPFPHPYIDYVAEWVGDWIQSSYYPSNDEEYSDLCCVFYDSKGCLDLSGDEWNNFWLQQLT